MPDIDGMGRVGGAASQTHRDQAPASKPAETKIPNKPPTAGGVLGGLSGIKKPASIPGNGVAPSKLDSAPSTAAGAAVAGTKKLPPPPPPSRATGRPLPPAPTGRMPKPGEMPPMASQMPAMSPGMTPGMMPDMLSHLQASGAMQAQQLELMQAGARQNAELQMAAGEIHRSETLTSALTSIMNKGADNIAKAAKGE